MMKRIAICGGIGSGKSMVSKILRENGAFVVSADEVNAELLREEGYIARIKSIFPEVVHNNVINKKELAELIYRDERCRAKLMELSHPIIFERMLEKAAGKDVAFFEIPLMSECTISFDSIWFVSAAMQDRVKAIVRRDGVSEDYAKRVISLQSNEDRIADRADVILRNEYDPRSLAEAVKAQYCSILRHFS